MTDWITMASGVAAAIGLLFTGYQVWLLNRQARHDRRVVLEGVAVAWRPIEAPSRAERDDGTSKWLYELVLVNPGRLPIDDVHIRWQFPCDVVRLRHDGITDPPTDTLILSAPVVVGGGQRSWRRHLLIPYQNRHDLSSTFAEVTFNDIDGQRRTNRWPRTIRQPLDTGTAASDRTGRFESRRTTVRTTSCEQPTWRPTSRSDMPFALNRRASWALLHRQMRSRPHQHPLDQIDVSTSTHRARCADRLNPPTRVPPDALQPLARGGIGAYRS